MNGQIIEAILSFSEIHTYTIQNTQNYKSRQQATLTDENEASLAFAMPI